MQSLIARAEESTFAEAPVERDRLILPRYLRRPLRFLARLEMMTPRHAGLKGATMLLLATGAAGLVMGGHIGPVIASVTSDAGLSISQVKISGQSETAELDVLHALGIGDNTSLATFDVEAARDRVEALPWVKQAQIRKLYPAGLDVELSEREAFALWRRGDRVSIIDREGIVLGDYLDDRFASLPLVVGDGASMRAEEVVDLLGKVPSLRGKVKAATLISDRRWTLVLANGAEILLPEDGAEAALKKVAALDAKNQILSRDVARIDVRLADRVVVGLTPEGVTARKAVLAERAKAAKKASPA